MLKPYLVVGIVLGLAMLGLFAVLGSGSIIKSKILSLDEINPANDTDSNLIPITPIDKPVYNENSLAMLIHEKVNRVRLDNNKTALSFDPDITDVAKAHSIDMNINGYFSHVSLNGTNADQRGINAGFPNCGDTSILDLEQQYYELEKKHNEKVSSLNARTLSYNEKVRQYSLDSNYANTFRSNDPLTGYAINKKYTDLQREKTELDSMAVGLENEELRLRDKLAQLNTLNKNNDMISGFGENISMSTIYVSYSETSLGRHYNWYNDNELADQIVQGWVTSPGHYENMLFDSWTRSGVGVSINDTTNEVFVTQDFC